MTGKELKEFALKVPDEAIVSVRERHYGEYEERFQMQASLVISSQDPREIDHV